ncbi:hypothetical protein EDB82DRAFT_110479 [Fusarium venenatum]|uniref:uncharacterized protein n=1 Tax=Fusarium venenatum TaxID=56646 RepID=UPI001D99A06C|nr:hypothetical protein EDB82DRAFT_110479 [Fusarium venenatum]
MLHVDVYAAVVSEPFEGLYCSFLFHLFVLLLCSTGLPDSDPQKPSRSEATVPVGPGPRFPRKRAHDEAPETHPAPQVNSSERRLFVPDCRDCRE